MAIALVVETDASSTNNTSVTTSSIDTTGATLIVIMCSHDAASATPTDSKGNTWTGLTSRLSTVRGQLFYCVNPTVGSGHTFTLTPGGTNYPAIAVQAFSGAGVFDQQNGAASSSASQASGNVTPTENNEVVVTGGAFNSTTAPSVSSPFSSNATALRAGTANAYGVGMAYEIQTTATTRSATWTAGIGGNASVIATFKEAAAVAGQPFRKRWGGVTHNGYTRRGVW